MSKQTPVPVSLHEMTLETLDPADQALITEAGLTIITAFECQSCSEVMEDDETDRAYECGECSGIQVGVENRRCESCNKFMARAETDGCLRCEGGLVEEVPAIEDPEGSGDLLSVDEVLDLLRSGETRTERTEREEEEREARKQAEVDALLAACTLVQFRDVKVGDYLVDIDRDGKPMKDYAPITAITYREGGETYTAEILDPETRKRVEVQRVRKEEISFATGGMGRVFSVNDGDEGSILDKQIYVVRGSE